MNADFLDAHQRHWDDADSLHGAHRWANADHLYGMAAECGLKRLMLAFGMPFDWIGDRPSKREDREHANGSWVRYETYRAGHPQGATYGLPAANPFDDWDVSQRYANQADFDSARVQRHRNGAELVKRLVRKARMDGLI